MNSTSPMRQLVDLAEISGIVAEYHDIWGNPHAASDATRRGLLQAMGIACASENEIAASLQNWRMRHWKRRMAPVRVVPIDRPPRIRLHLRQDEMGQGLSWTLKLESGANQTGAFNPADLPLLESSEIEGIQWHALGLDLPAIETAGYHRLRIDGLDGDNSELSLIAHPPRCHQPLRQDQRVWGLSVQLYGVRSARNWGMGDFTDLRDLALWAAQAGAGLIGVNPLHALFPHNPLHASPYSPSSREFLNTLYIDVQAVPDYAECAGTQVIVETADFQARLHALRDAELVDYLSIAKLKATILERLYRHFQKAHLDANSERAGHFRAFLAQGGDALWRFALYQALQEYLYAQDTGNWGWPVWPWEYRDPASPAVAAFVGEHQARIEYFQYLQWLAAEQLDAAGAAAHSMPIGLYQDLAVGVDLGGADTWSNQSLYAIGARIGCPPDDFSLLGQDWGLPPWIPERLREQAYAPFIAILRANMRGAGALRLDHVMGLMRLYWAPPGEDARSGAYLNYPLDDLLGILALESQRNQCLIVGEDLGTVPDAVRGSLHDLGVYSYRLFYFERNYGQENHGAFKLPREYPAQALVAGSTHDLPTLAGYWQSADIELRTTLGLYPSEEQRNQQIRERAQDRARLLAALANEGLLPEGMSQDPANVPEMTHALQCAIQHYLARTPSQLCMLQAEDLLGQTEQANLPGTVEQHPNWQRKLRLDIEAWTDDKAIKAMADALSAERAPKPDPMQT
ncbi:MAG: 4-alpha-glucanotransferase [Hydrogenophilales bacterium 28-61-23]|nr:MAG: 4-alpha-glucanotransferase [Hydrogenophilales bacterium 28-61-23]